MNWIKIRQAAALCKRPERTLRHYAIQGKIRCKKDGRDWLVDMKSLTDLGWVADGEPTPGIVVERGVIKPVPELSIKAESRTSKGSKGFDVRTLGVYAELLAFCRSQTYKDLKSLTIQTSLDETLFQLAVGYHEFNHINKVNCYRLARQHLLRAMVCLHIEEAEEDQTNKLSLDKVSALLAGLKGLIRGTEMRANDRRPRAQGAAQDRKPDD